MNGEIILKTPFGIQKFDNIDTFIITVFLDLESYLKEQIVRGVDKSSLDSTTYSQLQSKFKLFIVKNYSK